MSFEHDCAKLDRLVAFARSVKAEHIGKPFEEQCGLMAQRLDYLNANSPSTNGLLAISLMRSVHHECI